MKQVVIGIGRDGKPYVISAPKKIEIVFKTKTEKKRTLKKRFRTLVYRTKLALGITP